MKKILNLIIFVCGACFVMLQITSSRVFAPYLGTSTAVSSILSGIILASLALGYFIGGKISDKRSDLLSITLAIFFAAIYVVAVAFIDVIILNFLQSKISYLQIKALISSLILFAPPNFLLGATFSYIAKLQNTEVSKSGSIFGKLISLFILGNIAGSFLTSFVLLPLVGTQKLLLLISIILLAASFSVCTTKIFSKKIVTIFPILFLVLTTCFFFNVYNSLGSKIADVDTQYSRVWVYDTKDSNGQKVRNMRINNESSSAMFLDNNSNLVHYYTNTYDLVEHFNKNFCTVLMIGGAGYSYPKYFLSKYPTAKIDVVEIDPKVTNLAKKYFKLQDNPKLNIFHEDGRTFLNNKKNTGYDAILGDGFMSGETPFHLATKEAASKMYDALNYGGVVITNIISAVEGDNGKVLRAAYHTFKTVFPQVYVIGSGTGIQNVILIAIKSENPPYFKSNNSILDSYLKKIYLDEIPSDDISILTDDYAPVEYYSGMRNNTILKLINKFQHFLS